MKLNIQYTFADRYYYFLKVLNYPLTLVLRYLFIALLPLTDGHTIFIDNIIFIVMAFIPHFPALIMASVNHVIRQKQGRQGVDTDSQKYPAWFVYVFYVASLVAIVSKFFRFET
jgi:hypothetical protein